MTFSPALRAAVFSLAMIFCASALNAVMDTLVVGRYPGSAFQKLPDSWQSWLNPEIAFRNKWKDGEKSRGEAFPLSSSVLAFTTDGWHCAKAIAAYCLYLAIIAPFTLLFRLKWYVWLLLLILLDVLRGGVFELVSLFLLK